MAPRKKRSSLYKKRSSFGSFMNSYGSLMDSSSEDDDNSSHSEEIDRDVNMAIEIVRREQQQKNHLNGEDDSHDGGSGEANSRESPLRTASSCTTTSSSSCSLGAIQPKRRNSHRPPPPVTIPPGMQNNVLRKRERTTSSSSVINPIAPPATKSKMKLQQQVAQAVQSKQIDKNLARFNESFLLADGCGSIFQAQDYSTTKSLTQQTQTAGYDPICSLSTIPHDITIQTSKSEARGTDGGYVSDNSIELLPAGFNNDEKPTDTAIDSKSKEDKHYESKSPNFQSSFVSLADTTVNLEYDISAPKSSSKRSSQQESRRKRSKDDPTSPKNSKSSSRDRSEKETKSPTKKSASSKERSEKEPKSPSKKSSSSKDRSEKEAKSPSKKSASSKERMEKEPKSPSKKSSSSKDRSEKDTESPRKSTRSTKDETSKEPKSPKKSSSKDRREKESESPKKSCSKESSEKESKSPKRKSTSKDETNNPGEDNEPSTSNTKDRGEKESKTSSSKSSSRSSDVKEPKSPKKSSKDRGDKESKSSPRKSASKDPDSPKKSSSSKKRSSDKSKSPKKREIKETAKERNEPIPPDTEGEACEDEAMQKNASFRITSIKEKTKNDSQVSCDLLASLTSGSFWDAVDDGKKLLNSLERSLKDERKMSPSRDSKSLDVREQHGETIKKNGDVLKLEDICKFEQDDDSSSEGSESNISPVQDTSLKKAVWIKLENGSSNDEKAETKKELEKKFIAMKNKFIDSDSSDSDDSDTSDDSSTFVKEAAKQCAKHHEELAQLTQCASLDVNAATILTQQSASNEVTAIPENDHLLQNCDTSRKSSQEEHADPLAVVEALAKVIDDKKNLVVHELESESDSSESCADEGRGGSGDRGNHGDRYISSYEEQRKALAIRRSPNRIQSKSLANSSSIEERKKFLAGLDSATSGTTPSSPMKKCESPKKDETATKTSRFQQLQQLAKQNTPKSSASASAESCKAVIPSLPKLNSPVTPRKAGSKFEELRRKAMGASKESETVTTKDISPSKVQPVVNFKEQRQKTQGILHNVPENNSSIKQQSSIPEKCSPEKQTYGVAKVKGFWKGNESLSANTNTKIDINRCQEEKRESDSISVSLKNVSSLKDRKSTLFLSESNQSASAGAQRAQEAKSSNFANLRKLAMSAPQETDPKSHSDAKQNETPKITSSASSTVNKFSSPQTTTTIEDQNISLKNTLNRSPETSSSSAQRAQEAKSSNFAELRKQAMRVGKEVEHDQDCTSDTNKIAGDVLSVNKTWRSSVARQPSASLQNVTSLKDRMKFLEKKNDGEVKKCDNEAQKSITQTDAQAKASGLPSLGASSNLAKNVSVRNPQTANPKMETATTISAAKQTESGSKKNDFTIPDKDEHGRPLSEFARRMLERQRKQMSIPSE